MFAWVISTFFIMLMHYINKPKDKNLDNQDQFIDLQYGYIKYTLLKNKNRDRTNII